MTGIDEKRVAGTIVKDEWSDFILFVGDVVGLPIPLMKNNPSGLTSVDRPISN